jgi:hypothetical protein
VKGSDGIPGRKSAKKNGRAINRDVIVFTFFLFLSFGLWYINSLGKETEGDVKYPVKIINLPKDRILSDVSPDKLNFSLKGPGYSVLKLKLSGTRPPVMIDLSKVSYKRLPESKNSDYFIVTSALAKSLTVQIRSGCEIIIIKPDTLFFRLSRESAKPVTGSH